MPELRAVICLQYIRHVPEVYNCPLNEICCGVVALLLIRIDKSLTRGLVNHRILKVFLSVLTRITGQLAHISHPFAVFSELFRGIVLSVSLEFFFGGDCLFSEA